MSAPGAKKMGRDRHVRAALGETLYNNIKSSKVLLVGAGGIGCELLKNLVLTGFGEIDIVDLDTIDLSNLNRQFLFRHEHIKQSKATIAKETASKFNPNAKITAHHANIKDKIFSVDWFRSFVVVFNALDNLDARRHVNRMCLAANVPLVESGTTGFEGQTQVIKKGDTECYDCNPKPTPKSFPVCTIRSTPSQPIHCIVWAKSYLFIEIFGTDSEEAKDMDTSEDGENVDEINQLKQETRELKEIRDNMGNSNFGQLVFDKVFDKDIERLRSAEDMWKTRAPPKAMKWYTQVLEAKAVKASEIAPQDQIVWDCNQNIAVFLDSLDRLSSRFKSTGSQSATGEVAGLPSFDKDDKDMLDFVASAANIRSLIFGIEPKTEFDIKQMAGNIIPAIATTNAVTASMCISEAFKILRGQIRRAKTVFLTPRNPARIATAEVPHAPNPDCAVCSVATGSLTIDPDRAKLEDVVDGFLRAKLGYGEEISVSTDQGLVYDPDLEDNLSRKLSELGILDGNIITIVDDEEGEEISDGPFAGTKAPRVNLSLQIKAETIADNGPPIRAPETLIIERRPKKAHDDSTAETAALNGNGTDPIGVKRKREADDVQNDAPPKKAKASGKDDDVLLLDEAPGDGAIVIED